MALGGIAIGWGRWLGLIDTPDDVLTESKRRLNICDGCEFAVSSKFLEFINGGPVRVDGKYCSICKCPCHQKSITNEDCPKGFW